MWKPEIVVPVCGKRNSFGDDGTQPHMKTRTAYATRRKPRFWAGRFTPDARSAAAALIEERLRTASVIWTNRTGPDGRGTASRLIWDSEADPVIYIMYIMRN